MRARGMDVQVEAFIFPFNNSNLRLYQKNRENTLRRKSKRDGTMAVLSAHPLTCQQNSMEHFLVE